MRLYSASRLIPDSADRVFACLYARSDRVTKACSDAAQAALEQAK